MIKKRSTPLLSARLRRSVSPLALALLMPGLAWAEADAPADASDAASLPEVVVTAQRHAENLQKSSVVVQAITPDQLATAGVTQAEDLGKLVPGLQIGMGGAAAQIYVRGVGDFGSTSSTNPAVATNIDGVYIARAQAIAGNFYDLDRVEVLKGPQGTLYGRNATGGAINLITAKPKLDQFGGDVSLEIGNYGEIKSEAAINIPVDHSVAVRAAVQVEDRNGYASDGSDDDKHGSGRLQVLVQPDDDVSLLVGGDYSHLGGKGVTYYLSQSTAAAAGVSPWTSARSAAGTAALLSAAGSLAGLINPLTGASAFQDNDFWSLHAELTWQLPFATLTVLPSYRSASMRYNGFPAATYEDGYDGFNNDRDTSRATSTEVRLGNQTSQVTWVAGLFYFDEKQTPTNSLDSGLFLDTASLSKVDTTNYAVFGQATYSLTETLRLVAGGRYTYDRRTLSDGQVSSLFPSLGCLNPQQASCLIETLDGQKTFYKPTWKAGLEYDLTPINMLYVTASTGFKAGGFSEAAVSTTGDQASSYEPEKLTAYELGSRNRFFDNRLQVNLEGFYWQYDDHQDSRTLFDAKNVLALTTINNGNARMYGSDIDVIAKLTSHDTFKIAAEYLNSRYTSFDHQQPAAVISRAGTGCTFSPTSQVGATGPIVDINCTGFPLTHAPQWSGTVNFDHLFELGNGDTLDAAADVRFASSSWLASDYTAAEKAPGYASLDLNLVYATANQAWTFAAFLRNVTDTAIYTGGYSNAAVPGFVVTNLAPPRTYGVRAAYHF
jgi:iron complex outermembrane receptor protein